MQEELSGILISHYTKLELELLELLEFYVHAPAKRRVHQMRMNLKKQLTFLVLIKELLPEEELEASKAVIQTFQKRLGKVRDYQLQRDQVEQIETELGLERKFSASLKKRAKHFAKRWWKFREKVNIAEALSRVRQLAEESLPQVAAEALAEHILSQVRHVLFEIKCLCNIASFDINAFHELRTFLKRFLFNWNLLQVYFSNIPIHVELLNLIKALEHDLGEWHDYQSLLKKLDEQKHDVLVGTVKEKLENLTLQARVQLLQLEKLIPTIEPYFLSKKEAFS